MKNIYKLIAVIFLVGTFTSCEEDLIIFDADNGQTALSFSRANNEATLCNPTVTIVVESTTRSSSDRTYMIELDESTTALENQYSLASSTVTIAAGEFVGTTSVTVDFDEVDIEGDDVNRNIVYNLIIPDGEVLNTRGQLVVNYKSACVLNEVKIDITFDSYPQETAWQIRDSGNNIVAGDMEFGNHAGSDSFSTNICLPDGDYTYIIFDSFGDGICCAYGNGAANLFLVECEGDSDLLNGNPIAEFGANDSRTFTLGN